MLCTNEKYHILLLNVDELFSLFIRPQWSIIDGPMMLNVDIDPSSHFIGNMLLVRGWDYDRGISEL